jgi:branched-subunit amino acid aminotransferase/4-amino-4-deoxychorismate lyase
LTGVKSCNYLENILALEEAKKRGFDEVVRINEKNEIVSAAMANIFWTKDGRIFTPAIETGCLKGTTREFILENFPVCEKTAFIAELAEADEIFLTSAGIGICPANYEGGQPKMSTFSQLRDFLDLS